MHTNPQDLLLIFRRQSRGNSGLFGCLWFCFWFRQAQSQLHIGPKDRRSHDCCKHIEKKTSVVVWITVVQGQNILLCCASLVQTDGELDWNMARSSEETELMLKNHLRLLFFLFVSFFFFSFFPPKFLSIKSIFGNSCIFEITFWALGRPTSAVDSWCLLCGQSSKVWLISHMHVDLNCKMNLQAEAYPPDSNFLLHIKKDDTSGGLLRTKSSDLSASVSMEPVAEAKQPI